MKRSDKHIVWAALAVLLVLPKMAGAGCNNANGDPVTISIGAFRRVIPRVGNERSVLITVSPSSSIALQLQRISGKSGSAVFVSTGTSTCTISGTTTVQIRGIQQSWGTGATAAPNNMKLKAKVGGNTCASRSFTICSHPTGFSQTSGSGANGVLNFVYSWDSDSGSVADLNKVWCGEHVTYSDGGIHVGTGRPWCADNHDPTVLPFRIAMSGAWGSFGDVHSMPGGKPNPGPADSFMATQYYGYRCLRCNPGVVNSTLGWQTNLMGPITISRYVEQISGFWRYRISKSGITSTCSLP